MRTSFTLVGLAAALSTVLAQNPVINTPTSLIVCQPASITYSGGTAPYIVSVLPGGQVSAAALETFPTADTTTSGAYTWTVNIAAGTAVTLAIRDAQGLLNYSQQVTIQAGTTTACLTASGSSSAAQGSSAVSATSSFASSASSAAMSATSAQSSQSSAASSSAAALSSSSGSSTSSSPSASAATTSPTAKSGAGSTVANAFAVVAAVVLAIAA